VLRLFSALVALIACLYATDAGATVYAPSTSDRFVLESDMIVFGTVSSLTSAPTDAFPDLTRVELSDLRVVHSRWPIPKTTFAFNVRAYFGRDGGVRPVPHQEMLFVGARYLLFLRGGTWIYAPVTPGQDAIYRVDDNAVSCPGGRIYGVGDSALKCVDPLGEALSPPTEVEFSRMIELSLVQAASRRPELARRNERAARALEPLPTREEVSP